SAACAPCCLARLSPLPPFFFLRIPRPPSSPLFPYTTLFRSGDVGDAAAARGQGDRLAGPDAPAEVEPGQGGADGGGDVVRTALRSEEHTSELQSLTNLVCRLLLEKKKQKQR